MHFDIFELLLFHCVLDRELEDDVLGKNVLNDRDAVLGLVLGEINRSRGVKQLRENNEREKRRNKKRGGRGSTIPTSASSTTQECCEQR